MIGVPGEPTSEGLILKPVADLPADRSALNAPPPRPYVPASPGEERDEHWEKLDRHGDYRALGRALGVLRSEFGGDPVLFWVVDTMFLNPSRVVGSNEWCVAFEAQREVIRDATYWLAGWMLPRLGRRIKVPIEARRVEIDDDSDALMDVALRCASKREFAAAAGIRNRRRAGAIWDRARARIVRKPER